MKLKRRLFERVAAVLIINRVTLNCGTVHLHTVVFYNTMYADAVFANLKY